MNADEALAELLVRLKALRYQFTAITPASHARVIARPQPEVLTLRDIFGWSRPFREQDLDPALLGLLDKSGCLSRGPEGFRSEVRVGSMGEDLLLHSAYPTEGEDAVFFGPDTYRFVNFLKDMHADVAGARRIVDMGAGGGAGAIACARMAPSAVVTMIDTNPLALRLARINAQCAGVSAEAVQDDAIPDGTDLVIANPPYMIDTRKRAYRDGGDDLGAALSLEWAEQALGRLEPGGLMLLYTGAAITGGGTPLFEGLCTLCEEQSAGLTIEEMDPDIFGEELDNPQYARVERIAAVRVTIRKRSRT